MRNLSFIFIPIVACFNGCSANSVPTNNENNPAEKIIQTWDVNYAQECKEIDTKNASSISFGIVGDFNISTLKDRDVRNLASVAIVATFSNNKRQICSGSFFKPGFVISAAHCFNKDKC